MTVDKIGKETLAAASNESDPNESYIYKYHDVNIPPLSMVDDLLTISKCGADSIMTNAVVNAKFEQKRLELNKSKCHQIHVGIHEKRCPELKAHDEIMIKAKEDKYIGDILSNDGKIYKNIKNRSMKGIGIISNIMNIVQELSLGRYHFELAVLLRESMLLSSMLLNSETWVNVTSENIEMLESVDRIMMRGILDVPI